MAIQFRSAMPPQQTVTRPAFKGLQPLPAFEGAEQTPRQTSAVSVQPTHFSGALLPLKRIRRVTFGNEGMRHIDIPSVDLLDYLSNDAARKASFVQAMGDSIRAYGFVALKNHDIPQDFISRYYNTAADVFKLPDETKLKYARPEKGRATGYYERGQEKKGKEGDAVTAERTVPDPNEKWHVSGQNNVFPKEVPAFARESMQLYGMFDRLSVPVIQAVGEYLDSQQEVLKQQGFKVTADEGYLKSTVGENHTGLRGVAAKLQATLSQILSAPLFRVEPVQLIGSHVMRVLHYFPFTKKELETVRNKKQDPGMAIRAGQHNDLNLITFLIKAKGKGLQIYIPTAPGGPKEWVSIDAEEGSVLVNAGDMLSFITGGKTNERGQIIEQGFLPSIRHRVVGEAGTPEKPGSLATDRYSVPYFATPNYLKTLRNMKTGEEIPTYAFVHRRLYNHGSIDRKGLTPVEYLKNTWDLLRKPGKYEMPVDMEPSD